MTEIYINNLSYNVTEDELRNAFEEYGEVEWVKIITDRDTGQSRGFAFVMMASDVEATDAIKGLAHSEVGGRRLNVKRSNGKKRARPRDRHPRRPTPELSPGNSDEA